MRTSRNITDFARACVASAAPGIEHVVTVIAEPWAGNTVATVTVDASVRGEQ